MNARRPRTPIVREADNAAHSATSAADHISPAERSTQDTRPYLRRSASISAEDW